MRLNGGWGALQAQRCIGWVKKGCRSKIKQSQPRSIELSCIKRIMAAAAERRQRTPLSLFGRPCSLERQPYMEGIMMKSCRLQSDGWRGSIALQLAAA